MSSDNTPLSPGGAREALIGRERIRGATRMIKEGTDASQVTAETIRKIADDVAIFIKDHGIIRKDLAKAVGYSPGVISEFLAGTYAGNNGEVAIHLDSWVEDEADRRKRPATTQFVWTNVADLIRSTANHCRSARKLGMIYSP